MKGILSCRCGCGMQMKQSVVQVLQALESDLDFELEISSGARCEAHNEKEGGNQNSAHTLGLAADIHVENSNQRWQLRNAICKRGIKRHYGKGHIIHIDLAVGKLPHPRNGLTEYPQEVDWSE